MVTRFFFKKSEIEIVYLDFNKRCDKVSQDILRLEFAILGTIDTLGRIILFVGAVLYIVECLAVSIASIH